MSEKSRLRAQLRASLAALEPEYIAESDAGIFERLSSLPEFLSAPAVFCYRSAGREVSTGAVIALALSLGKTVALPVTMGGGIMEFARFSGGESELERGALGIFQPKSAAERLSPNAGDIILVPALSFDEQGYRLGQGGGYYDRYLSGCPAFTTGLCRERMLLPMVPRMAHDVGVSLVITESRTKKTRLC